MFQQVPAPTASELRFAIIEALRAKGIELAVPLAIFSRASLGSAPDTIVPGVRNESLIIAGRPPKKGAVAALSVHR